MKFLITNADDYGYKEEVSRAIIDCHKSGILTSTTALVNFISNEEISMAKASPTLGLGLHINLADGNPVSHNWIQKYGSFTHPKRNDNAVYDQAEWERQFLKIQITDIEEEINAQYNRFVEVFNKKPTHLDTHYFTSGVSIVFEAFLDLAKKYNLPVRHPMFFKNESKLLSAEVEVDKTQLDKIKEEGVRVVNYYSPESLILCTDPFVVIESEVAKILEGQTLEISFHPGYGEKWREDYNKILLDAKFANIIRANDIKLVNYAEFAESSKS